MENEIVSPIDGKVIQVLTSEGANVNTSDKLLIIG
ncbi:biotin/lipoyl-containing protein [Microaceticoccus formicicus]|nr:biotin/lipoyl-containing protein [Peptoniphilaceae bacterium AMB_02]